MRKKIALPLPVCHELIFALTVRKKSMMFKLKRVFAKFLFDEPKLRILEKCI